MNSLVRVVLGTMLLVAVSHFAWGQQTTATDPTIRVNVDLVQVDVQVLQKKTRRAVGFLSTEDFQLYENGVRQTIAQFSQNQLPLSVVLLFDLTFSVQPVLKPLASGGCGLRRSELVGLDLDDVQTRQGHWAIVDLIGKGGHLRTVPIPHWTKRALDEWISAARVTRGKIFRAVARTGKVWGSGISENVVWYVVRRCCQRVGLEHIAPHDLRRTCAKLCHSNGGELEQIQFLLGACICADD
jgi:hypothetical protein